MTSQILTEVHAINPLKLEERIQDCPDGIFAVFFRYHRLSILPLLVCWQLTPPDFIILGMNKLLQRLPDRSREEVRNQALVLIQQLTSQNEEMKKTVVFNEVSVTSIFTCTICAPQIAVA